MCVCLCSFLSFLLVWPQNLQETEAGMCPFIWTCLRLFKILHTFARNLQTDTNINVLYPSVLLGRTLFFVLLSLHCIVFTPQCLQVYWMCRFKDLFIIYIWCICFRPLLLTTCINKYINKKNAHQFFIATAAVFFEHKSIFMKKQNDIFYYKCIV